MQLNGMTALNEKELAFIPMHAEAAGMILFGYEFSDKHMLNAKKAPVYAYGEEANMWKMMAPIFSKQAQELWPKKIAAKTGAAESEKAAESSGSSSSDDEDSNEGRLKTMKSKTREKRKRRRTKRKCRQLLRKRR